MNKYEEALQRAKNHLYNDGLTLEQYNTIYTIFPELESKDERTRREISAFLEELSKLGKNTNFNKYKTSDCAEWIAWLKKQNKNKNINYKPTDEQINTLEHFIRSLGESGHLSPYDKNTKIIYSLLKDLKNLTKTNRYISWNNYDKDMIKALILIFEANKDAYWKIEGKHNDVVKADEIIAWLESLKDND